LTDKDEINLKLEAMLSKRLIKKRERILFVKCLSNGREKDWKMPRGKRNLISEVSFPN